MYRPAAIDQLGVLGESLKVPVYKEEENKNPVEIAKNALKHAKAHGYHVVIIDTAGRLAVDEVMMAEVEAIKACAYSYRNAFCGRLHDRSGCRKHRRSL